MEGDILTRSRDADALLHGGVTLELGRFFRAAVRLAHCRRRRLADGRSPVWPYDLTAALNRSPRPAQRGPRSNSTAMAMLRDDLPLLKQVASLTTWRRRVDPGPHAFPTLASIRFWLHEPEIKRT